MLEENRLDVLNKLIEKLFYQFNNCEKIDDMELDNRDIYFINNIDLIINIIKEQEDYVIDNIEEDIELPKMTKEEVYYYTTEILNEIDPSGEWLDIYLNSIKNNHIIYLNDFNSDEITRIKSALGLVGINDIDNVCLHFNDKERFLFLKYNGDISDVVLTIHELIHYISFEYDNVREALPMVREFPSIFYELYSLYYLSTLGYDKEIIKGINNNRLFDIYSSIDESRDIIDYLNIYINDGKIMDYISKNKCDKCIEILNNDSYIVFKTYPYIVGSYLARKAISKIKEDKTLFDMIKYITKNLSKIDVDDIFSILDINKCLCRKISNRR